MARFAQAFKRVFKQCQEDPRSGTMDLHNWLMSTHHAPRIVPAAVAQRLLTTVLHWCLHQDLSSI